MTYTFWLQLDNEKTQLAFDNDFKLLRIPYVFLDNPDMVRKFIQEFLMHGVVMFEIIDFYKQYPDNIYARIAEKQNKLSNF